MKLYDLQELADLLGRAPDTIKRDIRCNPLAVPPRVEIPGTRILRWREEDIRAWLASGVRGGGAA
jgi:predicted DNA-binding transcriptional regulator AlpA